MIEFLHVLTDKFEFTNRNLIVTAENSFPLEKNIAV